MKDLARDNGIAVSTAYDYRDEAIAVLAARKPALHSALLAAKAAGHTHVIVAYEGEPCAATADAPGDSARSSPPRSSKRKSRNVTIRCAERLSGAGGDQTV